MRISIRVPPCRPVDEVAALAARAEHEGIWSMFFPDSQLLWRDVFATMVLSADRTNRVGLATGVANLVTRHPSVIASAIRTVQEIAGDRVRLGLGAGSSSVRPLGLGLASNDAIEQAIGQIRALTSGTVAALGDRRVQLRDPAGQPPILLAATGPRRLELAGRVADGVIIHSGTTTSSVGSALDAVARGVAKSGRSLGDLQVVVTGVILVSDNLGRDARLLKPICCTVAQDGGGAALRAGGIQVREAVPVSRSPGSAADQGPGARGRAGSGPGDIVVDEQELGGRETDGDQEETVYPDLKHADDWEQAVRACEDRLSDDEALAFAEQFCFAGTPAQIERQVEALEASGVTEVLFQGLSSYDLPGTLVRTVGAMARRLAGVTEAPADAHLYADVDTAGAGRAVQGRSEQ